MHSTIEKVRFSPPDGEIVFDFYLLEDLEDTDLVITTLGVCMPYGPRINSFDNVIVGCLIKFLSDVEKGEKTELRALEDGFVIDVWQEREQMIVQGRMMNPSMGPVADVVSCDCRYMHYEFAFSFRYDRGETIDTLKSLRRSVENKRKQS
jgi:hypothetical protein